MAKDESTFVPASENFVLKMQEKERERTYFGVFFFLLALLYCLQTGFLKGRSVPHSHHPLPSCSLLGHLCFTVSQAWNVDFENVSLGGV